VDQRTATEIPSLSSSQLREAGLSACAPFGERKRSSSTRRASCPQGTSDNGREDCFRW
jgi:hypothetical protein